MFCYVVLLQGIAACPLVNLCKLVLVVKQKENTKNGKGQKLKGKRTKREDKRNVQTKLRKDKLEFATHMKEFFADVKINVTGYLKNEN